MKRHVEVVDTKKQEKPISRLRRVGGHQGRMVMGAPLVEAQQDSSVRVADLPPIVMSRSGFRSAKERLVPLETAWDVFDANDCPCALHVDSPVAVPFESHFNKGRIERCIINRSNR
jgi:hypothetical protein